MASSRPYLGLSLSTIKDRPVREALQSIDSYLKYSEAKMLEVEGDVDVLIAASGVLDASYITVSNEAALTAERRLTTSSPLFLSDGGAGTQITLSLNNAAPSLTLGTSNIAGSVGSAALRVDATIALFDAGLPEDLATAASAGIIAYSARRDHKHKLSDRLQDATGDQLVFDYASSQGTLTFPSPLALTFADNATLAATTLQTNRNALYAKNIIGATDVGGTGPSMYFDYTGDLTMLGHATTATHLWTLTGSLRFSGAASSAAIAPITIVGSNTSGTLELQNASAIKTTKWNALGTQILSTVAAPHLTTEVDQGLGHQIHWYFNPSGLVNSAYYRWVYEDAAGGSYPYFLGITNEGVPKFFVGRPGSDSSSWMASNAWGLEALAAAGGTASLYVSPAGNSVLFDNQNNNKNMSFRCGSTPSGTVWSTFKGISFQCDRLPVANDNCFTFVKSYADSSTPTDFVQFHHVAAISDSRNMFSMTQNSIKGMYVSKDWKLGLRDTSAAYDVTLGYTSSTALTATRALTIDVVNSDRTLKLQGNPTLGDWFDQSVKTTASPTFAGATIGGLDVFIFLLLGL